MFKRVLYGELLDCQSEHLGEHCPFFITEKKSPTSSPRMTKLAVTVIQIQEGEEG